MIEKTISADFMQAEIVFIKLTSFQGHIQSPGNIVPVDDAEQVIYEVIKK